MIRQIGNVALVLSALLAQTACSNGVESVSPESPGGQPAAVATVLAPASSTTGIGIVGSTVAELPTVIARDANGNPVPNITVTFAQSKGDGFVTGGIATTNSAGVARPGSWTLGKTSGANIVTATGGAAAPVTFTINAAAGPPALIVKIAGDNQIGEAGHILAVQPRVKVVDTYGNNVAGVSTVFKVETGGGTVSGSSVITDSLGNAAPASWTLGDHGLQTLTATAVSAEPVMFIATALDSSSPCTRTTGMIDGETVHSELTGESCTTADGRSFELFPVMLTDAGSNAHRFTLTSLDFDTEIELRDANMNLVASNNDGRNAGTNSAFTALVPAGVYMIVATSHKPGEKGGFDVTYRKVSSDITGCDEAYVARGIVTRQMATPPDCRRGSDYEDRYRIYLRFGEQVSVNVEDQSYSGPGLELTDIGGTVLSSATRIGFYGLSLTFAAPADGFYVIGVWGPDDNTTFSLTLR